MFTFILVSAAKVASMVFWPVTKAFCAQVNLKAAKPEAPSKGKKGKAKAKDIDLDDYLLQEPQEDAPAAAPEPPTKPKGKKGKKQGFSLDDFPEDLDQDPTRDAAHEPGLFRQQESASVHTR